MKDNDLFQAYLNGNEEAFRTLVERYQKRAFWVAFNILKDEEDARDAVQDAFVKVLRSAASFDPTQSFRTWLFRIVSNTAIDTWRRRKRQAPLALDDLDPASPTPGPDKEMNQQDLKALIAGVLDELPPKYKQVIVLRDIEGLSCKDIGEALGLTHATARWRLHHARKLFQEVWKRQVGVAPEEILKE